MEVRQAAVADLEGIIALQQQCYVGNLNSDEKQEGFLNTVLDEQLIARAIEQESAVFVAVEEGVVIGLAVCASWQYWSFSPSLTELASRLSEVEYDGMVFNRNNSYFWGPVCVSKGHRGKGVFEQLFLSSKAVLSKNYPLVYSYVHCDNLRSFAAHTVKVGFRYTKDFNLSGQCYKGIVYKTT
ncbi:GNAT family N-acetyltransferase [Photobacterium sanctipauli]|uniref:GNAT family N-acetyltransferase n=1 Tax=Photobacterium sanctipauli TaxID=1342794 RepID=A0A2T3NZK1_9GAMM|nr:GNAT family N-acetyltransferase [Photobacterium sanctipauli]PSW21703.1 GNAT family N-acetyltransferase [Photobacterium sanctipauli]